MPPSRGSPQPRNQTCVSCIAGRFFTTEPLVKPWYDLVVQSLSPVWLCDPMDCRCQASLSITIPQSLLKVMSIELVMPSNYLILCCPLLLLSSVFPSIRVFSNQSVLCIRWAKYWSFSFSISPSNEYSGLISFMISLHSKGLSRVFSNTTVQKHQFFCTQLFYDPTFTSIHDYRKNHGFD